MRVIEIEIVVPPGPRGELGFKIAQAGNQIFPFAPDDYLVTDNEVIHWSIEGANTSGAWQAISYNTGGFPHAIEVRFLCDLVAAVGNEPPAPLTNLELSSAPAPA